MKRLKTYVINMRHNTGRRTHMERLLATYTTLDVEFVDAVCGRLLADDDKRRLFDNDRALRLYGRRLSDGEIGCTLSHQLCYRLVCERGDDCALILEDDLHITDDAFGRLMGHAASLFADERPQAVLLSGDYWWTGRRPWREGYERVSLYDASCAQAYIINRAAARALLDKRPGFIADDWLLFKHKVGITAIRPHLTDQNRQDFKTEVVAANCGIVRRDLSLRRNIFYYVNAIVKRVLMFTGHFEYKRFKGGVL